MTDVKQYFKQQLDTGAPMLFYGIEDRENDAIYVKSFKEDLSVFPSDLVYVRQMCESVPVFRKTK